MRDLLLRALEAEEALQRALDAYDEVLSCLPSALVQGELVLRCPEDLELCETPADANRLGLKLAPEVVRVALAEQRDEIVRELRKQEKVLLKRM